MKKWVKALRSGDYKLQIDKFTAYEEGGGTWDCVVGSTEGETIAHAICLAALKLTEKLK
jgi:hypothetical protein